MAALIQTFDATAVIPAAVFDVIPPGDYRAQITQSEMRPTKDGNGQYLWLELSIIDGPYANRLLFDRLNLVNNNEQAVEIAHRALSAICHAVGELSVSDSEMLHFKPLVVTVRVRPAGPDRGGVHRDAANEIKGYKSANTAPRPVAATPQQAAKPAATGAAMPPWQRKVG